MTTTFARKLALGALVASSLGIGYAIGAQPHMAETITRLQSVREAIRTYACRVGEPPAPGVALQRIDARATRTRRRE